MTVCRSWTCRALLGDTNRDLHTFINDLLNENGGVSSDLLHRGGDTALYCLLSKAGKFAALSIVIVTALGRDLHKVFDNLLNVSVNGDALRADHLLGHGNLNTDGNLHLAWSLDVRDSYDALNDLICGDGATAINNLSVGARNYNSLDDLFHGSGGNLWTGSGIQASITRWAW